MLVIVSLFFHTETHVFLLAISKLFLVLCVIFLSLLIDISIMFVIFLSCLVSLTLDDWLIVSCLHFAHFIFSLLADTTNGWLHRFEIKSSHLVSPHKFEPFLNFWVRCLCETWRNINSVGKCSGHVHSPQLRNMSQTDFEEYLSRFITYEINIIESFESTHQQIQQISSNIPWVEFFPDSPGYLSASKDGLVAAR